jgi:hypothetical protein
MTQNLKLAVSFITRMLDSKIDHDVTVQPSGLLEEDTFE